MGPKPATRGGVNGSRSKFLSKFKPSAYVPKSPQTLEPRSAKITMDKLSRSRRPRSQHGSKERQFAELNCRDRSDRFRIPVRPVGATGQTGTTHRSDRSFPDSSKINLQTMNLEQTTFKSNETWILAPLQLGESITTRISPKGPRDSPPVSWI